MDRGEESKLFQAVGRIEGTLSSIEGFMQESGAKDDLQDNRLGRLESKVFFIWFIGPFLIGALAAFEHFKTVMGIKGGGL